MFLTSSATWLWTLRQQSIFLGDVIPSRCRVRYGSTTNLPFGKFNQIFANDAIAHAIVDRLVNDTEVFTWRVMSIGRTKDKKK